MSKSFHVVAVLSSCMAVVSAHAGDKPVPAPVPASAPAPMAAPVPAATKAAVKDALKQLKDAAAPPTAPPAAATPPAQVVAPSGPPPPAAAFVAGMKVFEGVWRCEGKTLDTSFTKAHAVKAQLSTTSDLGGYFYVSRYTERKTKENPAPYVMSTSVWFDPAKNMFMRVDTDNLGMVTHLASKGFEGDTWVWAGDVVGAKIAFKDTVQKKGDKETVSSLQMAGPDGKFVTIAETTCKK